VALYARGLEMQSSLPSPEMENLSQSLLKRAYEPCQKGFAKTRKRPLEREEENEAGLQR